MIKSNKSIRRTSRKRYNLYQVKSTAGITKGMIKNITNLERLTKKWETIK
jgi:hypothetical protein